MEDSVCKNWSNTTFFLNKKFSTQTPPTIWLNLIIVNTVTA